MNLSLFLWGATFLAFTAASDLSGCPSESSVLLEETSYPAGCRTDVSFTFHVSLVITGGSSPEDGTFNALAIDGGKIACTEAWNCCLEVDVPVSGDTDYLCEMEYAAQDSDLTIGVGFLHQAAILQAATDYPSLYFAAVDVYYDEGLPNLEGVVFREDQSGYLAGVISGQIASQSLCVVGGLAIPPVKMFINGFINGVASECDACTVDVEYSPYGFQNENNWGIETVQTFLDGDCEVVFGVGGYTGSAAILYASAAPGTALTFNTDAAGTTIAVTKDSNHDSVWVVGVDTDEWETTFQSGGVDGSDKIITSALKKVDWATENMISRVRHGIVVGTTLTMGAAEGGIDFADCHEACLEVSGPVSSFITQSATSARAAMALGTLDTGVDISTGDMAVDEVILPGCQAESEIIQEETQYPAGCRDDDSFTYFVSLVITAGSSPEDGTFNALAIQGAQEACDSSWNCCLEVDVPGGQASGTDYMCEMEYAAQDSDLTIGVGFLHQSAIESAADDYPDLDFAAIDVSFGTTRENLEGITFREDESGFLAGVLAGQVTTAKKIGIVGGLAILPVKSFVNGFINGVAYVCSDCEVSVEYSTIGFQNEENFGILTCKTFLQAGCDVIWGVGGYTGSAAILYAAANPGSTMVFATDYVGGTVEVTKPSNEPQVYVIGVDSDEYLTTFQGGTADAAEGSNMVITSALKNVDIGTKMAIERVKNGQAVGDNIVLGVTSDGVGFAGCHDACASDGPVTTAIIEQTTAAENALKDGTLNTGIDLDTGENAQTLEGCDYEYNLLLDEMTYPPGCRNDDSFTFHVSLIITGGSSPEDGTYNALAIDGAQIGCSEAWGCCLEVDVPRNSDTDYLCEMQYAAIDSDLTIGVGFLHAAAIETAATNNPDLNYAAIDVAYGEPLPNLEGVLFREDQSGYLAGIIAGQVSTSKKLGVVAGIAISPVKLFVNGFILGVASVCADCTVSYDYSTLGFQNEENWGVEYAQELQDTGVDVIFGAGGYTGSAALLYASAAPGSTTTVNVDALGTSVDVVKPSDHPAIWVVGVDTDEYTTTFQGGSVPGSNKVITSALKKVDWATENAIINVRHSKVVGATIVLGASEGGIGYAPCHGACSSNTGPVTSLILQKAADALTAMQANELDLGLDLATGDPLETTPDTDENGDEESTKSTPASIIVLLVISLLIGLVALAGVFHIYSKEMSSGKAYFAKLEDSSEIEIGFTEEIRGQTVAAE